MIRRASLAIVILIVLVGVSPRVRAQAPAACADLDLSEAISLLVQAQIAATKGDSAGAAALIAEARQLIDAAAALCGEVTADQLPELAVEAASLRGTFTVRYPAGWQIADAANLFSDVSEVDRLAFASSPNLIARLNNGGALRRADSIVITALGTPMGIARSLGAFDSDLQYTGLDSTALLLAIIAGAEYAQVAFSEVREIAVIDSAAAITSFKTLLSNGEPGTESVFLVRQYAEDQFIVVIAIGAPGLLAQTEALAIAVAGSVRRSAVDVN